MKKILVTVLVVICFVIGVGLADDNLEKEESDQYIEADKQVKPVNCWSLMYVLEGIKAQGLNVVWQAQNKDDEFQNNQVLFTNDSNVWVLLELNDTIACVLGAGDSFILLDNRYNQGENEL